MHSRTIAAPVLLSLVVVCACSDPAQPVEPITANSKASSSAAVAPSAIASAAPSASARPVSSAANGPPTDLVSAGAGAPPLVGPLAFPPHGTSIVFPTKLAYEEKAGAPVVVDLPFSAQGAALRDVNGDGSPELVVFKKREASPAPTDDPTTVWVFGKDPTGNVEIMTRLDSVLIGVTDEASLDDALAKQKTLGPVDSTVLPRVIVRLENATPAEMRGLIGKAGLRVCDRLAEKKTCKPVAVHDKIDAKMVERIAHAGGKFAEFGGSDDFKTLGGADVHGRRREP